MTREEMDEKALAKVAEAAELVRAWMEQETIKVEVLNLEAYAYKHGDIEFFAKTEDGWVADVFKSETIEHMRPRGRTWMGER